MKRKNCGKTVIGCGVVAGICFGIAGCGYFCSGRTVFGWIFAVLSAAQLILALTNYLISKKNKKTEFDGEGTE